MQRIFIGIKIPNEIRERIAAWRTDHDHIPVRWIRDQDLHITIIPPWNEMNVRGVQTKIRAALRGRKFFNIEFHKIIFAPNPRKPRLIWAEGYPTDKLQSLKIALHKQVNHTNIRALRPHITLARFKRILYHQLNTKLLVVPITWRFIVNSVVLYESPLAPRKGYRIIEEFKFDGSYDLLSHSAERKRTEHQYNKTSS